MPELADRGQQQQPGRQKPDATTPPQTTPARPNPRALDRDVARPAETAEPRFAGVVAVDGPSGTGKSTVARRLARRVGARYLDTGAMYRAATLAVLDAGITPDAADAVVSTVRRARIEITTDPDDVQVRLDGRPVDAAIRAPAVTSAVSAVAAIPEVRHHMVAQQRELIDDGRIVVEGRDIGSVVWPQAETKVYLTASERARAVRRAGELGPDVDVKAVADDLRRRDDYDSSRPTSPLVRAAGAIEVDTTDLSIDEVVDRLVDTVMKRSAG